MVTLPRQDQRPKPRNGPPTSAIDPAIPNLAALRVHEQTVLGWMMSPANHEDVGEHLLDVSVKHFLVPAHQEIYGAVMTHAGVPNIAVLVATSLVGETAPRSVRNLDGGLFNYLSECREYADMLGVRELAHHVGEVRAAYLRRKRFELHTLATRALEADDLDAYDVVQTEMRALRTDDSVEQHDRFPQVDWDEAFAEDFSQMDWNGFQQADTETLVVIRDNLLRGLDEVAATLEAGTFTTVGSKGAAPSSQSGQTTLALLAGIEAELAARAS